MASRIFPQSGSEKSWNLTHNFDHFSHFLFLKDKSKNVVYSDFQAIQSSIYPLICLQTIFAVYFLISRTSFIVYHLNGFAIVASVIAFLTIICGWVLILFKFYMGTKYKSLLPYLVNLWSFGLNITLCVGLLFQTANQHTKKCQDHDGFFLNFGCNTNKNKVSDNTLLLLMILPAILSMILKEIDWKTQNICWLINITLIAFCIGYYELTDSILAFALYLPFTLIIMFSYRLQSLQLFFATEQLYIYHQEKERVSEVQHVTEMRSLIGNMAHDLKTPLAGFTGGIETITSILQEMHQDLHDEIIDKHTALLNVEAVLNVIENVTHTNSFMLMTINRCIDFTKASNGVKLEPRLETINLHDILNLPLMCLADMQNRIKIVCEPMVDNICNFVITDKQWLQENLLCLMSNAVKFTIQGDVRVSVSLYRHMEENMMAWDSNYDRMSPRISPIYSESAMLINSESFSEQISPHARGGGTMTNTMGVAMSSNEDIDRDDFLTAKSPSEQSMKRLKIGSMYLLFEVEDSGVGIEDPEILERLFSPFKQAQRFVGGTGLGLYSLAKRIEALKGSYGVKTRKDGQQGCLFYFTIPYRPDHTAQLKSSFSQSKHSSTKTKHSKHNSFFTVPSSNTPHMYTNTTERDTEYGTKIDNNSIQEERQLIRNNILRPLSGKPSSSFVSSSNNTNDNTSTHNNSVNSAISLQMTSVHSNNSHIYYSPSERNANTNAGLKRAVLKNEHLDTIYTNESNAAVAEQQQQQYDAGHPFNIDTQQIPIVFSNNSSSHNSTHNIMQLENNAVEMTTTSSTVAKSNNIATEGTNTSSSISNAAAIVQSSMYNNRQTIERPLSTTAVIPKQQDNSMPSLNILLVDDALSILKMTTMILTRKGHTVTTAENGAIALSKLTESLLKNIPFDVVLMDIQMPVMDGIEATRRWRKQENPEMSVLSPQNSTLLVSNSITSSMIPKMMLSSGRKSNTSQHSMHSINSIESVYSQIIPKNKRSDALLHGVLSSAHSHENMEQKHETSGYISNLTVHSNSSRSLSMSMQKSPGKNENKYKSLVAQPPRHQIIIGVSANSDHDTMKAACFAGVDAFISKPFTMATFQDTYEALGQKQQLKEFLSPRQQSKGDEMV